MRSFRGDGERLFAGNRRWTKPTAASRAASASRPVPPTWTFPATSTRSGKTTWARPADFSTNRTLSRLLRPGLLRTPANTSARWPLRRPDLASAGSSATSPTRSNSRILGNICRGASPQTGKSVAVIGAGPGGLAAAYYLGMTRATQSPSTMPTESGRHAPLRHPRIPSPLRSAR